MYYVYALKSSKNGDLYIGFARDLKKRVEQHNKGLSNYTKRYAPWLLIYYEAYRNKFDATKREKRLKLNHRAKEDLKLQITKSWGKQ
ncbi:MAG: hypothetical protein A3C30_01475 [Candidatus Levybacteria bacterium RIFCSPHIGHO2_02_FULL_40_18]|nr:MAG: hypothetical protein A2869_01040 [Candidatus Levybacteria bacterium RIFCSPHIGHO2_01_FULL_40_58]OGH26666.1 MAG: hypothetical protein A3C30_01475 [Candidatus Levybacteria bacterium RIFCSPHIGHO2_02_FULL_40_18]OGH31601.1 MAG: hypothetical protein A3E43_01195 [Candidatus Levybacteria bacterium RIFCSPHIGHO2_12_FULL_40_31]OGH40229.1 MAG: hypothetical protein A2894_02210 [Candidatus Levybacteria bacterium RIFCSPLOWO2_01_FULL_40_64]OGH49469.1 MAG: hypothetical protein A3I54_05260 [Candidatus Lev